MSSVHTPNFGRSVYRAPLLALDLRCARTFDQQGGVPRSELGLPLGFTWIVPPRRPSLTSLMVGPSGLHSTSYDDSIRFDLENKEGSNINPVFHRPDSLRLKPQSSWPGMTRPSIPKSPQSCKRSTLRLDPRVKPEDDTGGSLFRMKRPNGRAGPGPR